MPKFQALYNIKDLTVPFIEKDSEGNITRDQSIVFNRGMNSARGFIPAYFHTNDTETVNYLRTYPGNKTNGGSSYEEVEAEPVKTLAPAEENSFSSEPVNEVQQEQTSSGEIKVYDDVTTVNEASAILLEMFEELVTRDVNTRAKITAVAESKGISFPNL